MAKIINLSGISASGKSTYANRIAKETGAEIICADTIRGELAGGNESDQSNNYYIFSQLIPARIKSNIVRGRDVILDVTAPDKKGRKLALDLGKELGVEVECHYIAPDVERSKKWNQQRSRKVPDDVIDRQAAKWQTPVKEEGFSLVIKIM
jgi:predicted kinase